MSVHLQVCVFDKKCSLGLKAEVATFTYWCRPLPFSLSVSQHLYEDGESMQTNTSHPHNRLLAHTCTTDSCWKTLQAAAASCSNYMMLDSLLCYRRSTPNSDSCSLLQKAACRATLGFLCLCFLS